MKRTSKKVFTVNIMGRNYPVKCTEEEEKDLIRVEEQLKQQLNNYRLKYEQLDIQDCLSMALIENQMNAFNSVQADRDKALVKRIDRLQEELSETIS